MKKIIYLVALLVLSNTLLFTSCSDDDANNTDISQQIAAIENNAASGDWIITNFNDSGIDETADFSGYVFRFDTNGTLTATSTANTLTGNWSVTDDSSSDDIDFNIFFPVADTSDFDDLNDDWDVVSSTATRLELIDISGGDGSTDRLIFEKN